MDLKELKQKLTEKILGDIKKEIHPQVLYGE